MAVRFSLENLTCGLVAGGGLVALGGDELSLPRVRDAGLLMVLLGALTFGLHMIVSRRAEIATRYSRDVDPDFHVFRGWGAVAWGIVFILFTAFIVGYLVIDWTDWTGAAIFFQVRPGLFVIWAGILLTAWGFANASKATYRYQENERPASRWGDRLAGILVIPLGLAILGFGLLRTFAAPVADWLKAAILTWFLNVLLK